MNRDVFLSLLALDAYNRGYGQNVFGLPVLPNVTQIGRATITTDSQLRIGSDAQAAGFYAIAYEWNGETIISAPSSSWRGSNFPGVGDWASGCARGWRLAA